MWRGLLHHCVLCQWLRLAVNAQENAVGGAAMGNVWQNTPVCNLGDVAEADFDLGQEMLVANLVAVATLFLAKDLLGRFPQSNPSGCPSVPGQCYWESV